MITQVLHCPNCHGADIVKHGTPEGKQRYKCRESICDGRTFILDYAYPGQSRGCETTAKRIWQRQSPATGNPSSALAPKWEWGSGYSAGFTCESQYCNSRIKKKEYIRKQVNLEALKHLKPEQVEVDICLIQPPEKVE